jgi:hypothetical protein
MQRQTIQVRAVESVNCLDETKHYGDFRDGKRMQQALV